jgi:hypothetical protein
MKKIYIFSLLILFTSCATDIDYHIPLTRFDSPETKGEFLKGGVGINWGVSHKVKTAEVAESIFPDFIDPSVNNETQTSVESHGSLNVNLGLLKRLDFNYENYGDGPSMYGAKFQFYGDSEKEDKKGLKASIKGSVGAMKEDEGTLSVSTNSGARTYNGNIDVEAYDVALNIGYRFNSYFIGYLNSIYSHHQVKSELNSSQFSTVVVNGKIKSHGFLLGTRVSNSKKSFFLKLEAGYFKSVWNTTLRQDSLPIGMGIEFGW